MRPPRRRYRLGRTPKAAGRVVGWRGRRCPSAGRSRCRRGGTRRSARDRSACSSRADVDRLGRDAGAFQQQAVRRLQIDVPLAGHAARRWQHDAGAARAAQRRLERRARPRRPTSKQHGADGRAQRHPQIGRAARRIRRRARARPRAARPPRCRASRRARPRTRRVRGSTTSAGTQSATNTPERDAGVDRCTARPPRRARSPPDRRRRARARPRAP